MKYLKIFIVLIFLITLVSCVRKTKHQSRASNSYTEKLDSLMRIANERELLNGNVLISKNNKIIYQKSFGFTNASQNKKLTTNSIFNIGSIAKQFNGVAIMILVEQGKLSLEDTVSKFNLNLPSWAEKVKIKHLINYVSGAPPIDILEVTNDEKAWKALRSVDTLLFEPGTDFRYDNSNVFLQKRIIEKVTKQSFQEFVSQNILKPLKMNNTFFDPEASLKNRTSCYDLDKNSCPKFEFITGWPWMTTNDLNIWINALNTNSIIGQESYSILLENSYVENKTSSLGEYFKKDNLQRHNGISYKFESIILNDKKNDVVIIILSNQRNRIWDLGHEALNIMQDKLYTIPKKSVRQVIRKVCLEDVNKGIEAYNNLKQNNSTEYAFDNSSEINRLGYDLIRAGKAKDALKIFELGISEFPNDANLYDSYGEALFLNKTYDLSIKNYKKSLEMNPKNQNAVKMIKKINKLITEDKINSFKNDD